MRNKIVFDIETKNTFSDVGGRGNLKGFEISVVGAYFYNKNEYICYEEHELDQLEEEFKQADLIVGYSSKDFDAPILGNYFNINMSSIPHFDIHEKIEEVLGRKINLNTLGEINLGIKKTASHGLKAIEMYNNGEMEELKKYCLQDVRITKEIFDQIERQGTIIVPGRGIYGPEEIEINTNDQRLEQQGQLL